MGATAKIRRLLPREGVPIRKAERRTSDEEAVLGLVAAGPCQGLRETRLGVRHTRVACAGPTRRPDEAMFFNRPLQLLDHGRERAGIDLSKGVLSHRRLKDMLPGPARSHAVLPERR